MSNKVWDRISYAQSERFYAEKPVDLSNWKPAEHTEQTKAAEDFNRRCRIGKQKPTSPSIYFFPDFGEDDA